MVDSIGGKRFQATSSSEPVAPKAIQCDDGTGRDTFDHGAGNHLCNCTGPAFKAPFAQYPLAAAAIAGRDAAFAPPVPVPEITKLIEARLPDLFETYKDIHQNPELAGSESRTRGIVAERMKKLGYEVTENFGKYPNGKPLESVIAICKNGEGPTLLVRADMDALPIIEKTNVPYASTKKVTQPDGTEVGVMHACGHDVHTTNLMGFADIMMQLKDRWSGTLMLVAQPAEEALGGAQYLVESGLYDKFGTPDAAIGLHCYGPATPDVVATRTGQMMAEVDSIDVTMHGRGGHGSTPQATIDPVPMLLNFVNQTYQVVARNITPGEPALITTGQIQVGTARNIIADSGTAKLTVRSYDPSIQKTLLDGITRSAKGSAISAGAPKEPTITKAQETYPAVINSEGLTQRLVGVWQQQLTGAKVKVQEMPRIMAGEDFSRYAKTDRSVPTTFFFVGATPQEVLDKRREQGLPPPVSHTADFLPDAQATMRTGMLAFTTAATHFLQKKSA